ncbi:flagellar hook-length control protein FliK [Yersinia thracica]|uniref:flagellar hook-length control protein FliK n=1 Tax=Yersinia thracica TaxID=2890319 RepID=UPI00157C9CAF|nr:flagellar hook-length control protein FliK [Yersinia thracica]
MITLTGFAQAGSQLAVENTPIVGNAEEGGTDHLAGFDEALSQAWVPHQPILLRPSVVMDLIAKFDGNLVADDAGTLSPTDEQNQQLLDVLLQFHGQNTPMKTVQSTATMPFVPVVDSHQIVSQLASDNSSSLINLPKSISPRLDITAQPTAPTAENLLLSRIMPEGISAAIPTTLSHIANNSGEVVAPRMESQLTLAANPKAWSQQLHNVLGERLQLQVENKVQHATIRLDPPDMGKIDISVHMEGGKLQVHINASQGDVYRALQQSCAELRQTLTGQNSAAVEVQISANSPQQQQQQQQRQQQNQNQQAHADILAARHIEAQENMSADDGTLLITV